jgi:4,5:9,10-diseco-3-hydroxy-5,9,17-trioxoandrosta-1(10),2-diene-4-oate hydrolase
LIYCTPLASIVPRNLFLNFEFYYHSCNIKDFGADFSGNGRARDSHRGGSRQMAVEKTSLGKIATVEDLFIQVDGARIHYKKAGSGPPLVLIHGLVGSAKNWHRNIGELAYDATVYAIDLLNMGESDRVPGLDASLKATADIIARWMEVVGIERAHVAAVSHGGALAMMLAVRHPQRVGKLILFAPANPFCTLGHQLIRFYTSRPGSFIARVAPFLPRFISMIALGRMYGDPRRATLESLQGYTAGLVHPGTVEHILAIVRRWHKDMAYLRSVLPQLASRSMLLVWGDRDRAVGLDSARQLERILPHSHLVVVRGAGHLAFEEMPEICNHAMREWLAYGEQPAQSVTIRYSNEPLRQLKMI